jgi:tripartite-type tricarboxylate transporter receptor subunit TctC
MRSRTSSRRSFIALGAASLAWPALAAGVGAIRLVLPFSPGSGTDAATRILAEGLSTAAGRQAFVENRPGGNTVIGALEVMKSPPDGNTLLITTGGHITNGVLMKRQPYDSVASFTPITMLTRGYGWVLAVGGNSPYMNLQQFLEAARKSPGKINYGSSGIGNGTHVMAELFARSAGIRMTHVPYKGTPITDLISGTIDCSFQGVATVNEMVRTGRLRVLAVSSDQRLPIQPAIPTFKEFGIDANIPAWFGVFAPAKVPPQEVEATYQDLRKAALTKAYQDLAAQTASEIVLMPPREFLAYLNKEVANYKRTLTPLNIEME